MTARVPNVADINIAEFEEIRVDVEFAVQDYVDNSCWLPLLWDEYNRVIAFADEGADIALAQILLFMWG